jgi:hypothetical protein
MACLVRFDRQDLGYSVVVEDDDRVAYAYLLRGKDIIGDVWLYNRFNTPEFPEWREKKEPPFLNSAEYTQDDSFRPIHGEEEVAISWVSSHCALNRVEISVRGRLVAALEPGSKPGWCCNARKNGPLARVLEPS